MSSEPEEEGEDQDWAEGLSEDEFSSEEQSYDVKVQSHHHQEETIIATPPKTEAFVMVEPIAPARGNPVMVDPRVIITKKKVSPQHQHRSKVIREHRAIMGEAFPSSSESQQHQPEHQADKRIRGWDAQTEATIKKWQGDISKSSFIYGEQLEGHTRRLQRALIITLVAGSIMTVLAAVSITIGQYVDHPAAKITFDAVLLVGAAIVTIVNGLNAIFGWDFEVRRLTRFIERLDSQWFVFETEMNIPRDQRQPARDFIMRADGDYMHLMQQCPYISVADYVTANKSYQTQLSENFVWQQKFKNRIQQELARVKNSNDIELTEVKVE